MFSHAGQFTLSGGRRQKDTLLKLAAQDDRECRDVITLGLFAYIAHMSKRGINRNGRRMRRDPKG